MESGTEDCFSESSSDELCSPDSKRIKYSPDTDDCSSNTNSSCSPYTVLSASASPQGAASKRRLKLKICFPMLKKNIMKRRQSSPDTCDDEQSPAGDQDSLKTKYLKKVRAAKYIRKPEGRLSKAESSDDISIRYPKYEACDNADKSGNLNSRASGKAAESLTSDASTTGNVNSIVSLTHRELMLTLKDAGALDGAGHLQPVAKSKLTVKLVMAAVNVLNFSDEDICSWVHQSRTKESSSLTDLYSYQFDCYKIMYRLICSNIETSNGQKLLRLVGVHQYRSPQEIHSWQIIFHEIPPLLRKVSLGGSIQDQSICLNTAPCDSVSDNIATDNKLISDCYTTDGNSISNSNGINIQLDMAKSKSFEEEDQTANLDQDTIPRGDDVKNDMKNNAPKNRTDGGHTSFVSQNRLEDFLSKIELLTVLPCNKSSCETDVLSRMVRIEQQISSNNSVNWHHHIEERCEIEEVNFRRSISQLNSCINFVKEKDVLTSSVHVQKEKSLKEKPVKEKLMFLYQSNRSKSRKIAFLRSQVHLLERVVNQYTNQLQSQKRVSEVLKRKMTSLEDMIGQQKSRVLDRSEIVCKTSGPQTILTIPSNISSQGRIVHIPLQRISTVQTSPNSNTLTNVRDAERSIRLFGQQALAASRIRSFDCGFNGGGKNSSEAGTQCDLIFEENLVLKLPNSSVDNGTFTNSEVDTVKQGILNFVSEKFKSDSKCGATGPGDNFKRLVDNLILLELMLHKINDPLSTVSSTPSNQTFSVIDEAEKLIICVETNDLSNPSTKRFKQNHLLGSRESSSVKFGENVVDVSLLGDHRYWEHLEQDHIEKVVGGLAPFLALNTNPKNSKAKQKMIDALCDKEAYDKKVNDLCMKIITTQEQYEEQLKQTRSALRKKCDQKVRALEDKLENVQHEHAQEYNNKVQQMSETIEKYSALIRQHESNAQEFASFRNSVSAGEEILSHKLDSVYVSIYHSLLHEDSTVKPPEEMKLHATNVHAKVSCVFALCSPVSRLRTKLEEYETDCARFTDTLLSIDSVSATLDDLSTSLCSVKQRQRNLRKTTNKLTERYEVTLQNYEKEKIKLDLQNEELMLSNAKLTAAGRQIGVLVSSLETQEMALKYERERVASKLTASEELCAEKETLLEQLRDVVEKEQWRSSVLRKELDEAKSEISKLAVFWELLEVDNSRVSLNLSKTSNSTETSSITPADMSMLEHITQWGPNIPGTNDTVNMSLSSDVTQLCPCESSTSPSNIFFKDSASVSSTVALESSEDISSLAEFVFGNGRLSEASSPVSSSTVQACSEVVTLQ